MTWNGHVESKFEKKKRRKMRRKTYKKQKQNNKRYFFTNRLKMNLLIVDRINYL